MNAGTPINGGTVACTDANNCGINFQAYQSAGQPPFTTSAVANAMMSRSDLTGCPSWDSGCTTNPLANLNALASPPDAAPNNGVPPNNIVWANNSYQGPIRWVTYLFGGCLQPRDATTGKSMPSGNCNVDFANWQAYWMQDQGSTYSSTVTPPSSDTSPPSVSISAPTAGTSAAVGSTITINASASDNVGVTKVDFLVDGVVKNTDTTAPYSYAWNTTGIAVGSHGLVVKAYDAANNVATSTAVNVTLTSTSPTLVGDCNADNRVNALDLSLLISRDSQNYPPCDFNSDGTIGAADMAILLAKWTW